MIIGLFECSVDLESKCQLFIQKV